MTRWPPLLIAVPLAACATPHAVEGPVALNRMAYVGGPRVVPRSVVEDSRCPIRAQCVWAGRLVVRVTVLGGAWSRDIDITLGEPTDVADGRLTLVAATPQPVAGTPARPASYRFTFTFQGGL